MMRWIFAAAAVVIIAAVLWYQGMLADLYANYPDLQPVESFRTEASPLIIAHRGDEMHAPENTLAAFEGAIAKGADFIEVDMRLTADGVPVVMHDNTVDRTTDGTGSVAALTFAELRELDAGGWFGPEFAGTQVPTVAEVLQLASGRTCVLADIKPVPNYELVTLLRDFAAVNGRDCVIVAIMNRKNEFSRLKEFDFPPEFEVKARQRLKERQQLHDNQMRVFRRYWPDFPLVLSYIPELSVEENLAGYPSATAVHVGLFSVAPEAVAGLHAAGYFVYTLVPMRDDPLRSMDNATEYYAKLDAAGVDAIFVGDLDEINGFFGIQPESAQ